MIEYQLDNANSVFTLHLKSALTEEDFTKIGAALDSLIEAKGSVAGVIVDVSSFAGWESFGAMVDQIKLCREHHKFIKKLALLSDSDLVKGIERVGSHFLSAELKQFPQEQFEAAKQWIIGG